jgi:DNA mismatch repair ATPase MutL
LLDRLVDSGKMKKAIESLYTAYLPKGASPFVYIRYVSDYLVHNAFSRLI